MFQDPELGAIKPKPLGLSFQSLGRLLDRFFRQVKRAPVNGHKALPLKVRQELERFLGSQMRHFHDRTGQIRSDRNGGQVKRTQANANLLEDRIIACVSSEKDSLRVSGHSPRAPKPLVPIPESTAREMLSRETGHGETFDPSALPPIQLFHLRDADLHKPGFESQGDKKYRMVQLGQSSDCFQIKMIIVIMRDKDQIN